MDRLISEKQVLDAVDKTCCGSIEFRAIYERCEELIKAIPSAEPKTGHWIGIDEEPHEVWECDHCGFVIDGSGCIDPYDYRDTYKFCPNCGCRMFEPQEISERNLKMWHDIFEEEKRREGSEE